jgi:Uma2 family endonuclease
MTTIERRSVVVPANWVPGPKQGQWTYADFTTIPEDGHRYEIVDGVLYMAPSPSLGHQGITGEIFAYLRSYVQMAGLGRVFIAPADVELSYKNVVQPDVFVVLNEYLDRIAGSRLIGAPDLVVEVASPSTARHNLREKQDAYSRAGVAEYWIVTPGEQVVEVLVLAGDFYSSLGVFGGEEMLPSRIVPDMPVRVQQLFAFC